jgi:putative membrane protein
MYYENYFWGMDIIWWVVWFFLLIWIFAVPYDIPGQRRRKDSPLDILKARLASGQITREEYEDTKRVLENDSSK